MSFDSHGHNRFSSSLSFLFRPRIDTNEHKYYYQRMIRMKLMCKEIRAHSCQFVGDKELTLSFILRPRRTRITTNLSIFSAYPRSTLIVSHQPLPLHRNSFIVNVHVMRGS